LALQKGCLLLEQQIKPNVVVAGKNAQGKPIEELHAEGSYKMNHNGTWLDADALQLVRESRKFSTPRGMMLILRTASLR
jgi:hypothetical protein